MPDTQCLCENRPPMRRRILLGLLALALLLGVGEIGLQVLAHRARADFARGAATPGSQDALRVLCVGDSHTYGAGVERDEAYPAQLQAVLGERLERPVEVLNGGFPGVNSAFVALRLEAGIERWKPHVVVVWVGTNNRWNALETESWETDGVSRAVQRILLESKLYRLAKVLWATGVGGPDARVPDAGEDPGLEGMPQERRAQRLNDAEIEPGIRHDMEAMVAIASAHAVPIVFVAYPLVHMKGPNAAIVSNARRLGVPVVETAYDLARARRDGHPNEALIIDAAGPHPTGLLYGYVARSIAPVVVGALGSELETPGDGSNSR